VKWKERLYSLFSLWFGLRRNKRVAIYLYHCDSMTSNSPAVMQMIKILISDFLNFCLSSPSFRIRKALVDLHRTQHWQSVFSIHRSLMLFPLSVLICMI